MSKVVMTTPISKAAKQHSADPGSTGLNPFDSDSDSEMNPKPTGTSSVPVTSKANCKISPISYHEDSIGALSFSSSEYSGFSAAVSHYKNDFRDLGGLENQTVKELENYAVYKAEETTEKVNSCLKIAEDIREDATRTLVTLHQQGEQITRTHSTAADIEHDLSRVSAAIRSILWELEHGYNPCQLAHFSPKGKSLTYFLKIKYLSDIAHFFQGEKLLGTLGGLFSKTWKPKKNRPIMGPVLIRDDPVKRKGSHLEQRERLGISSSPVEQASRGQFLSEPKSALEKVEVEKVKQDDALSDLSNLLGQLKEMAVDMGSEMERQNTALGHLHDDVDEIHFRVKGAKLRGRRLLGE